MGTIPESEKKSKRTQKNSCFARRHLSTGAGAYYLYMLAVSSAKENPTGIFWSNARRDAWEFDVSRNTVTAWLSEIEEKGFAIALDEHGKRNAKGQMASIRFEVLTHAEWVSKIDALGTGLPNPAGCRFPPETFLEPVPKKWDRQ